MARSRRKFLFISPFIIHNILIKSYVNKLPKKINKIVNKHSRIPPQYLYLKVKIHKGNLFINKIINKWMVGRSFGEFILTKKPFFYPQKKSKKKNIRR